MQKWILEVHIDDQVKRNMQLGDWITSFHSSFNPTRTYSPTLKLVFSSDSLQSINQESVSRNRNKKTGWKIYPFNTKISPHIIIEEPFDFRAFITYFYDRPEQELDYTPILDRIHKGEILVREWIREGIIEAEALIEAEKKEQIVKVDPLDSTLDRPQKQLSYKKRESQAESSFNKLLKTKKSKERSTNNSKDSQSLFNLV